jgi:hypothetical protein
MSDEQNNSNHLCNNLIVNKTVKIGDEGENDYYCNDLEINISLMIYLIAYCSRMYKFIQIYIHIFIHIYIYIHIYT